MRQMLLDLPSRELLPAIRAYPPDRRTAALPPDDAAVRRANPTVRKGMLTMRTALLMRRGEMGFLRDTLIIARTE